MFRVEGQYEEKSEEQNKEFQELDKELREKVDLPDLDLAALREKYQAERDKRLRPDGEGQYMKASKRPATLMEDPHAPEIENRDPIDREVEVAIIGAGWAGLLSATHLKEVGVDDLLIFDAAGDFGGVWYWNRYPGCQCDTDAYIYLPLLEETNYLPSSKYVFAPEIQKHARRIAETYSLYENTCFQTRVRELRWNKDSGRWIVSTDRGDAVKARYVVTASGPLNIPRIPDIPGMDDFEGKIFHTSRWDYDYTGGDNTGNNNDLSKLADKRVAFVGTGGTGIQVVSHLGEWSKELYVFQRTPSSVGPRMNKPTDPQWAKSLKPGWQAERRRNFDDIRQGLPVEDLVNDAFTTTVKDLKALFPKEGIENMAPEEIALLSEYADALVMEAKRSYVDAEVKDPEVAEKLKPWYRLMCKRPTFNDEFYQTFNRPNVTLVDTSECHGIERLTRDGIIANGTEYKVDCIILATGFEATSSYRKRIGFETFGEGGKSIFEHWGEGMRTLHGWGAYGFPNWFYMGIGQNGFSINYTNSTVAQAEHIAHIIKEVRARGATRVEPTADAEEAWVREIRRLAEDMGEYFEACTPGVYNNEGQYNTSAKSHTLFAEIYGPGPSAFQDLLKGWRDEGDLDGLELS